MSKVNTCHLVIGSGNYFLKNKIYIIKKKYSKNNNLRANDKVTRVQELTFFLNPNGNLTEGTKTRLKKNLKSSNNLFFS